MKKKCLIVSVILLFIGVAIAPSININIVKASNDNDLVEVTTQACGINGYGNTTVKLTRQQYQNLEQYLVEFRERLNKTTTREEAVPIFKEAVVELNKYGLLPKGMSVEQAQQFVAGRYEKIRFNHLIEKTSVRNQMGDSNNSNYLCLVCSVTDGMISVGPIVRCINNIMYLLLLSDFSQNLFDFLYKNGYLLIYNILYRIILAITDPLVEPWIFAPIITTINPIKILYTLTLGGEILRFDGHYYKYEYVPSSGWVATFGLNGIKIFQDQPLWGHLPQFPIFGMLNFYYPGIFDFTGIGIILPGKQIHLGSALWVKIGSEPPS